MRSAGPLSARPAMIAAHPTARRRPRQRLAQPGMARMGPMLTTGFDGPITTSSASPIAPSAAALARAVSAPSKRTPRSPPAPGDAPRSRSWKSSSPPSVSIIVRSRSSLAGSTRAGIPSAAGHGGGGIGQAAPARMQLACDARAWPGRRHRSGTRSPRRSARACAMRGVRVRPPRPSPPRGIGRPASVYRTLSMSGHTRSPWSSVSSPTLTITLRSPAGQHLRKPWASFAPPVPPARSTVFMRRTIPSGVFGGGLRTGYASCQTSLGHPCTCAPVPHGRTRSP